MRRSWIGVAVVSVFAVSLGLSACAKIKSGKTVQPGSTVTLRYSLTADNVPIIPAAAPQGMKLRVGDGKLPALFEKNLIGLSVGASKTIALAPEEAFGPLRRELIARVPRNTLPAADLKEGMMLTAGTFTARVAKILEDGSVVIDRNHPLAGKHLTYQVRVASVE